MKARKLTLEKLSIENFKGIRNFIFEPHGENKTVYAENGIGKTTIFDAFLWLLFGKNSEGKADFDLRPLDESNNAIKGLVLIIEAKILIEETNGNETVGIAHVFRKEHHERVVKNQLKGYEAVCSIDQVPKKKGEYEAYIAEIISEDVFKMLTDLQQFNTMHWTDRRRILLELAGKIKSPKGFDELLGQLNGRSIADYKKVLSEQKKAHGKERDEINPRLDEIHKGLEELSGVGTKDAGNQRSKAITAKAEHQGQKQKILDDEESRQKRVEAVTQLKAQKTILEGSLSQGDPSKVSTLCSEKLTWEERLSVKRDELAVLRKSVSDAKINVAGVENNHTLKMQRLGVIREEYKELKAATLDDTCSACGQSLPADKVAGLRTKRDTNLQSLADTGNKLNIEAQELDRAKIAYQKHLAGTERGVVERESELAGLLESKEKAIAEINKKIKQVKAGTNIQDDSEWKRLDAEIKTAEGKVGPSMTDGIKSVDEKIEACNTTITAANLILANKDSIKKDNARIAELENREKELAQLIADIDKLLKDIDEYKAEESRLIEAAVNGKFQHVTFKLFKQLLNEGIEDTCEALLNGTPYAGMSTGERMFVGIDIINVLSEHYDVSVVLFVDHTESLTMPLETEAQVIGLFAEKGMKELTVK